MKTPSLCILQISQERTETNFNYAVWGGGCEREEDYFLHVLQNLSGTSKESTPHSSKRCLFTFQEQLMVHRTHSCTEEHAPINTEILLCFPIYPSNTPFIALALCESLLEAQGVRSTAPLKPASPTHRVLNTALLAVPPLLSSFKQHFGALCRIWLLHSTPSTMSEVA